MNACYDRHRLSWNLSVSSLYVPGIGLDCVSGLEAS